MEVNNFGNVIYLRIIRMINCNLYPLDLMFVCFHKLFISIYYLNINGIIRKLFIAL
jgi:hypothetical protein